MQPYNYNVQQINPMGSALKGMQTGMAFNQLEQQEKLQAQQVQSNLRLQQDLGDLSENYSHDRLNKFLIKNPSYIKQFQPLYDKMSTQEKDATIKDAMQFHAMSKNNPKAAIAEARMRAKAYREAGDEKQARFFEGVAETGEADPKTLLSTSGLLLAGIMGYDKYAEATKNLGLGAKAQADADTAQQLADADTALKEGQGAYYQKQADFYGDEFALDAEKVANESQKILNDAKRMQMENDGVLPPEKKIDIELRLRNQYWKEGGEKYELVNRAYNTIKDASKSGIGSLTTVLSYMKAIDPGSTVTGNEVITAQDAPGLSAKMINIVNKVFAEGEMGETAREQFLKEAENLRNTAKKMADKPRARITSQAKGYGLNIGNIFTVNAKSKIKDRLREKMKTK